MAGRIRDEDVALVKERADIAEVVGDHVTLRNAGGGSLKGLCPFHDEKSPSFQVRRALGYYKCFGCGEGGDVISFLTTLEHLTFTEAVERLADRFGVQLRYEEGGAAVSRPAPGQRQRLVAAHQAAAQFYAEQLATADAVAARRFLSERGFDRAAAERFGVGHSPRTWEALVDHLRGHGFTDQELLTAGLAQQGQRGVRDRFVGRLMWPIRDLSGDVVGFGARRLYDDDRIEAKYLNTAETPVYKKSGVLYGLDVARKEIARRRQAVVVEGYTDVMACHLAGVETAVATCGTAFGADHIKVLRRLLMDQDEFRGEVIYTFDGDEAGRKAALKAFGEDQRFVTQTFVAVEPGGLDPCDLRIAQGDAAVRDLVARRVPLFEFAVRSVLSRYDLDTEEGRLAGLDAVAPIVAGIRDVGLRQRYAVSIDRWLGLLDEAFVLRRISDHARGTAQRPTRGRAAVRGEGASAPDGTGPGGSAPDGPGPSVPMPRPNPDDPALLAEREALKLVVQFPHLAGDAFDALSALDDTVFTAAPYARVAEAIAAAGGAGAASPGEVWVSKVHAAAEEPVRGLVAELAVEPVRADGEPDPRYAAALVARLEELEVTRRLGQVKARLQRLNPVESVEAYNRLFSTLIGLEQERRALRERVIGGL